MTNENAKNAGRKAAEKVWNELGRGDGMLLSEIAHRLTYESLVVRNSFEDENLRAWARESFFERAAEIADSYGFVYDFFNDRVKVKGN